MDMTPGQARTLHHLTAAFCREDQMPDVVKAYDAPMHENWLRITVGPWTFLVSTDGTPEHVLHRGGEPQRLTR